MPIAFLKMQGAGNDILVVDQRRVNQPPPPPERLRALADALARRSERAESGDIVRYFWPGVLPRNAFFLVVVLLHGFRRLAPPS